MRAAGTARGPERSGVLRAVALGCAGALLATTVVGLGGCARGTVESQVVRDQQPAEEESLTPQERGQVRREALDVARTAWAAFEANDTDAMRSVCATDLVDGFVTLYEEYEAEGRSRVRSYDVTFFDVTSMTPSADRITATVRFIDGSYYIEADGTRTEPAGAERSAELVLMLEDDRFLVVRIIASPEVLR